MLSAPTAEGWNDPIFEGLYRVQYQSRTTFGSPPNTDRLLFSSVASASLSFASSLVSLLAAQFRRVGTSY